ncbi:hypothetical protein VOI54_14345 [Tamlana sp. 2201CG12-4]|uniref:hypothetical protein n=1 Tax=Tamlana sp. 2201CG12-4 TaxID=3112582 RepID=UPI002DBF97E9|nr:hypothetical protein [Tamlana sp. 2201CG12-4]MEC3908207.1 hypothetical protein [Tamlana sp. 2201CG12-4]
MPPYNTKLNSYTTSIDVKLRLYLTMTDVNVSNRQVRLKLKIQGHGINVQSVDFVTGAPFIFLNGGIQQQLTNIDLAPYFQLNNLVGINPQQYNQPLPDGTYKICWEVYDFLTGQRISDPNMGCSNILLLLNDPPLLNVPNRGAQLTDIKPTNIIFQWTPRHANATNVSYEFELREIWDTQIDPQAGFLASSPYHTETTFSTTLLYNISKPQLYPGRTYAWRVQAKSTTGLSENSVFRNNGYSEIYYFKYTNTCYPPTYRLAEPLNTGRVKISWQTHPDHNKYHIQYRKVSYTQETDKQREKREQKNKKRSKKGQKEKGYTSKKENHEWFEVFSYNNQTQIGNLQAGITYEFRVGGSCDALTDQNHYYTYSTPNQFTMPKADETVSYSCGIVPEIDIANTNPLGNLGINETFTAGDFPVTVKEIQGSKGVFSGKGFIVVPYLADTKIAVEFSRIKINTDYQLYDGVVKTTYDPNWSSVESVDDIIDEVFGGDNDSGITDGNTRNDNSNLDENANDQNNSGNTSSNTDDNTNVDNIGNNDSNTTDTNITNSYTDTSNNTDSSNTGTNTSSSGNNSSNTGNTEVVIVYENKNYNDGDVIEVEYHEEKPHFALLLKNYPKDATFNWQVLKGGTDNTSAYATNETMHDNLGIDMKKTHILDVVVNYNDKKIQVTIKRKSKEFKLLELYALHNQKRLAKSGETLYLINPPSLTKDVKTVKYGLHIDPKLELNLMPPSSIEWSYDGESQYFSTAKTNVTRSLEESDNIITTSVNAGNPNALEKSVDVEWVDEYKETKSYANKIKNFLKFFKVVNEVSDVASTVMPCQADFFKNFDKKIIFKWINFNREDNISRHILETKRFQFEAAADNIIELKCGKRLAVSVFGYSLGLGEIYAQLGAGLNVSILKDEIFYHEGNQFKEKKILSNGGIKVKGEVGLTIGGGVKDDEGNLIVGVVGGGKINITGGGKIEYPYKGNKHEILGRLYINPLMYAFTATVKLGPLDKDFTCSDILWNIRKVKEVIYNMETDEFRD